MAISGTDDMGAYIDTGCNTVPTTRPSTDVDIHSVATNLRAEVDTGTTVTPTRPPSRRGSGQRR